jgi:hypothetical protein
MQRSSDAVCRATLNHEVSVVADPKASGDTTITLTGGCSRRRFRPNRPQVRAARRPCSRAERDSPDTVTRLYRGEHCA